MAMEVYDPKELWEITMQLIRPEVSDTTYEVWIKKFVPVAAGEDTLSLRCYNEMHSNLIKTHYLGTINAALAKAANRPMKAVLLPPLSPEEREENQKREEEQKRAALAEAANPTHPTLNPRYTFSTFVVGTSNRFAHAAAFAVAEAPGNAYNPLFLYSGVGLGKTHLMHAIGHTVLKRDPGKKVMYVTSEAFTNELITAIQSNRNNEFRNRYRSADILMVDDIQFIAGKEQTQEEFFHTFNTLYESGKQIVLSSDKQPKEIPTLEERLRSRFEWGLIADIAKPDFETRIAILRRKAELEQTLVPDEITALIATKIESNIRELEGSLNRVIAYARLNDLPLNMDTAQRALAEMLPGRDARSITPDLITAVVAQSYGVTVEDMKSPRRSRDVSVPRQIAMYLTRELSGASLPQIGLYFGNRDHTTVMHAIEKVTDTMRTDNKTKLAVEDAKKRILSQ